MDLLEPQLAAFPGGIRLVRVFYAVVAHTDAHGQMGPCLTLIHLGVLGGASELGQAGMPGLCFFLATSATEPL